MGAEEYTDQEDSTITIVKYSINSLSLIGSLFIIIVYLAYKDLQSVTFKLVFYVSIADFLKCCGLWLPNDGIYWLIQAWSNNYFPLVSVAWNLIIAWCLYLVVVEGDYEIAERESKFFIYCFTIPLPLSIIPLITGDYGHDNEWCWILQKDSSDGYLRTLLLRFFWFYLLIWVSFILIFVFYYKVRKVLTEELDQPSRLFNRLFLYPLVLVFTISGSTAYRIFQVVHPDEHIYWWAMLTLICWGMQGFLNALVYGFTDGVRDRVFGQWCGSDEINKDERDYSDFERNVSDFSGIDALLEPSISRSVSINA